MLQTTIIGNLGADAKKIEGTTFKPFVSLSVSHNEKYTAANGTQTERTTWCNVIINWNCDNLLPYLTKGTKIYAEGDTRLRAFTDQQGQPHAAIDVIAHTIQLCGGTKPEQQPTETPF